MPSVDRGLTPFDMGYFERSVMGEGHEGPPSQLCCYCSDDHEIWHSYQA